MSSSLARKQCAQCGEESLEPEWACWACGTPFDTPAGAPTLLPRPRRRQGPAMAAAAALILLLVGIGLGFWLARATQARPVAPDPVASAFPGLQPGADLLPAPPLSGGRPAPPVRLPPPPVAPRAMGNPWGPSGQAARPAPAALPSPRVAPVPIPGGPVPGGAFVPAPVPARPRPQAARVPGAVADPTPVAPPHGARVRAKSGEAQVTLVNTDSAPMTVQLRGPEEITLHLAPGSNLPCRAKPGAYQLLLPGGGGGKELGTLILEPGKKLTIRFDRSGVRA
jgi:hypothetical protein